MDNELRCFIDMFSMTQKVILPNGENNTIATKDLIEYIPTICYSMDIPKVHFYGNDAYISGLIESTSIASMNLYGNKIFTVEVN